MVKRAAKPAPTPKPAPWARHKDEFLRRLGRPLAEVLAECEPAAAPKRPARASRRPSR